MLTDHDSLRHMLTSTLDPTGRMARWLEWTQEFDLHIKYIPGKSNVVADALSRVNVATLTVAKPDSSLLDAFKGCYSTDPEARKALQALAANRETEYVVVGGLLYKKGGRKHTGLRLYVPKGRHLRKIVLAECHDSLYSGHMGREKTLDRVKQLFYWPGMDRTVEEYVRTCPTCMLDKPRNDKRLGLLSPMPVPSHPWQYMGIDLITCLPDTERGHNAILTCVCPLTKMAVLTCTNVNVDAEGVARLVRDNVVKRFGMPKVVISDRDPRWTSTYWRTLLNLLGSKANMSTAFHPETDGQTERVNRVVEEVLRHHVSYEQTDWDTLVPMVEFAINTAKHASTGYTPFFLNHGREAQTPASFIQGVTTELVSSSSNAAAEQFVQQAHTALERAKESLQSAKERQARYANEHRKEWQFQRGDKVKLSNKNLSRGSADGVRKLDHLWSGPFTVTEQVGTSSYRIAVPHDWRVHDVFHISQLAPYHEAAEFGDRPIPRAIRYTSEAIQKDWYAIEKFVDVEKTGRAQRFKVHWKGYPHSEDSWEKAVHLKRDLGAETFYSFVEKFEKETGKTVATRRKPKSDPPTQPKPSKPAAPLAEPTRRSSRIAARQTASLGSILVFHGSLLQPAVLGSLSAQLTAQYS